MDNALVKALARAFCWKRIRESGKYIAVAELAERVGVAPYYLTRVLRLMLLAPAVVEVILDDTQGPDVKLVRLLKPFPVQWETQRVSLC